jgi:hypothetical protein
MYTLEMEPSNLPQLLLDELSQDQHELAILIVIGQSGVRGQTDGEVHHL